MINMNWVKNIDGSIYMMKFISTMGINYLVEVSSYPIDNPSESRKSLVELSSEEMIMCEKDPVKSFDFIHNTQAGMMLVLSSLLHYPELDPEFENITISHVPILTFTKLFDRRKQASIEHNVDGCVVNNNSCLLKILNWVPSFKDAKTIIDSNMEKHIETIKEWEAVNCPKPTNEAEKTTEESSSESSDDWIEKTWNGLTEVYSDDIWKDGETVYYSHGSDQYVLDKSTSTWIPKTWNGLTWFNGYNIWTDGEDIYYSVGSLEQYVLDKATSTWNVKIWIGLTDSGSAFIWTDGNNTYYSHGSDQYVLDKSTSTWIEKTWNGLTWFNGYNIWTDGGNIYYSFGPIHYVLDKTNSTWIQKTWNGLTEFYGSRVWTDGNGIYYSYDPAQYVLDRDTSTWSVKTWNGLTPIDSLNIWTDGENTYYSYESEHCMLSKNK